MHGRPPRAIDRRARSITVVGVRNCAAHWGTVTSLDLSFCERLDDAALGALVAGNPGLQHVCLTSCTAVTDAGVAALVAGARGVTSLCLELCRVSDLGVQSAARGLSLASLSIGSCPRVVRARFALDCYCMARGSTDTGQSNVGIQIIAAHGRRLGKLDLSGCECGHACLLAPVDDAWVPAQHPRQTLTWTTSENTATLSRTSFCGHAGL